MKRFPRVWRAIVFLAITTLEAVAQDRFAADLPQGVQVEWSLGKAWRQTTPGRDQICLNGLWRWQPANDPDSGVPQGQWGYFKVPGAWPGITDYMQKDSQIVFPHSDWKQADLSRLTTAWYEREITIPSDWSGRKITLSANYLNSFAAVFIDGRKIGEIRFPSGELDLTDACGPGEHHVLSLLVVAMPLKGVMLSYTDSASAREVKGAVARRGLCGDVYLIGTRETARVSTVKIDPSVRKGQIAFAVGLAGLDAKVSYRLRAQIIGKALPVATFESALFTAGDLKEAKFAFSQQWKPEKFWDIHTPSNQYDAVLSLVDAAGNILDASSPVRFGFRELWIQGRDFYLNGSRIFLSAVPLDNAEVGAAWATYDAARESLERLKSFGINFVYTHNYGCEPGSHLSFDDILRAADDVGMLVSLSQPHFSHFEWKSTDADRTNGYARIAEFYTQVAQNHPSVVFYSMSHNATGYSEDMNPDLIDGIHDPRDQWSARNAKIALRAEAIVARLDPSRIIYHHASGNLGSMHAINFYPNFAPIQELSDWFEHWSTQGVKPAFMCEYGAPFTWDWTLYRGWYQGQREFGSAKVPWEFCLAEWNAQFFGDRAYQISDAEKANLRWEAKQFRAGNLWHRWDYPVDVGSTRLGERYPVFASYLADNWRAFRGWEVSAISPWEYEHFWKARDGVSRARVNFKVDWENLQRPGFSPDYVEQRYERMDLAFKTSDWVPTEAALALIRNNRPLLAFIAGKTNAFTSKDHNFQAGETVEKQLIVINNSRETVRCRCKWSMLLVQAVSGSQEIVLPTGEQARIPLRIELPSNLPYGKYELKADFDFAAGETQHDSMSFEVLSGQARPQVNSKIALFDPQGETETWLTAKGIHFTRVDARTDLAGFDLLIVGKSALTVDGAAPDISRVVQGLKVLLFEQTSQALEQRFGFRVEERGLRTVFKRVPDHPLLAGIASDQLRDWRGAAALLSPRLTYEMRERYGPTVQWCGIPVTRVWRCGNRGNVASVLIEKPPCGDFLPILDGGFNLQYSPLLEYHEGAGLILFCQMDLTGRTETDPAAERLGSNIFQYLSNWKASGNRKTIYVGEPAGKHFLEAEGFSVDSFPETKLLPGQVLVAGPGSGVVLASHRQEIAEWLKADGRLLAIGLDDQEANAFLPFQIQTREQEHISSFFEPAGLNSLFSGLSPANVHNRDARKMPLVAGGAIILGDGVLARAKEANVLFCQIVPWQFDETKKLNVKRTQRNVSFLLSRMLGNLGSASSTPILARFSAPLENGRQEPRWLTGLYLDRPEEMDDPYRFFRW